MASLSYDEGAHLLRRAGFGGTPEDIDGLSARGREGAVDFLINFNQIDNSAMESLLAASFNLTGDGISNGEIRRWWFTRMVNTKRQFEEKMTLFWHNHFATSSSKVQDFFMLNQNVLLRCATARSATFAICSWQSRRIRRCSSGSTTSPTFLESRTRILAASFKSCSRWESKTSSLTSRTTPNRM